MPSPIGPKKWNIRSFFTGDKKTPVKKSHSKKTPGIFEGVKKLFYSSKSSEDVKDSNPTVTPSPAGGIHEKTSSAFSTVSGDTQNQRYIDVGARGGKPRKHSPVSSVHEPQGDKLSEPVSLDYVDKGNVDLRAEDNFFTLLEQIVSEHTGNEAEKREKLDQIQKKLNERYIPGMSYVPGKYFFEAPKFHTSAFLESMIRMELNLTESTDYIFSQMKEKKDKEFATVLINKDRYKALSDALQVPIHLYQVDREGDLTGVEIEINRHLKGVTIHIGFPLYPFNP